MDQLVDRLPAEIARTLEHEMRLLQEAIAVVASGVSPRVILANLRLSGQLLDPGRRLAAEAGVRLVALWNADEGGVDIAIEGATDAPE